MTTWCRDKEGNLIEELYLITFTTMPNLERSKWAKKSDSYKWFYSQVKDILERYKES